MNISEQLLMLICDEQREIGRIEERLVWLQSKYEEYADTDARRPLIQQRISIAEHYLAYARKRLVELLKECYEG